MSESGASCRGHSRRPRPGEPGLAMPCHNACEKRLEKLVYSQRVTPHIDGAVALEIEIGGEPVFQLAMGGLRRIEERGTKCGITAVRCKVAQL